MIDFLLGEGEELLIKESKNYSKVFQGKRSSMTYILLEGKRKVTALRSVYDVDEMGLDLKSAGVCVFSY